MLKNSFLNILFKNFTLSLILVIFFNFNIIANTQSKYKNYQIELIVFKSNTKTSAPELPLKPSQHQIIPDDAIDLRDIVGNFSDETEQPKILPNNELKFSNISKKINNDRDYSVISHIGWLQPKKNINKSKALYFTIADQNTNVPTVTAVVKFQLQKFLHSKISLSYKTELQDFVINEKRRLRNKELNYLDHPEFGAILVATER